MDTHALIGDRLHVYRRDGSPFWQCATYLAGRNHRTSTKERDLERAKKIASDWYLNLQVKKRAGELTEGPTFRDAATKFEAEYGILTQGERSPKYVKGHSLRLSVHLLPFLGDKVVSSITPQTVQDYRVHRMTSRTRRRVRMEGNNKVEYEEVMRPARSTIHQEIITLRHVLKTAQRQGWIAFVPDLSAPYKGSGKISHRAWFSADEYKQLYTATRERAADPPKRRWTWECEQLHDFVLFMVNTGLRPDEAGRLQFRDVEIVKDTATNETILEINVRGKRGVGYCKSMPGAVKPFERLKTRKRLATRPRKGSWGGTAATEPKELILPRPTDLLFPDLRAHHLNAVLDEEGLKFDREGLRRSAYSLRHTYICLRLMEGADIYQIAKNCRTSVEMIEKFYAAHIKNMIDAAAVNVRREAANAAPSKRKANAKRSQAVRPKPPFKSRK
jgi:integrase